MEENKNLAELTADISNHLLDSINLTEILEEMLGDNAKSGTIIALLLNNLKTSFESIEKCRQKIYIPE